MVRAGRTLLSSQQAAISLVMDCGKWNALHIPLFSIPQVPPLGMLCIGWFEDFQAKLNEKVRLWSHEVTLVDNSAAFEDEYEDMIFANWN